MLRYRLTLSAVLAGAMLLAHCSGLSQLPPSANGGAGAYHRAVSWMSPKAKRMPRLLYVSDYPNAIDVYDYRSGDLVGSIDDTNKLPEGMCVDKRGNVWVANFSGSVTLYLRGATTAAKSFATDGSPMGCSVAPNGDLAVTNLDRDYRSGNVQIWKNGSGQPQAYTDGSCFYMWPGAYDDRGNLYVEGLVTLYVSNETAICELPANGSSMRTVNVNQTIEYPAGAAWDGKYLVLTSQGYGGYTTALRQVTEDSSGNLTVVGTTVLTDTCISKGSAGVIEPFIVGRKNTPANHRQGKVTVGGNLSCEHRFDYWQYPGGGNPAKTLPNAPKQPWGQAVSIAP